MSTAEEIRQNRIEKLNRIEDSGISAYPIEVKRTHEIAKALKDFDTLAKDEKEVILVGRIRTLRSHGALTFIDFEDGTGRIQALFAKDKLGEKNYHSFLIILI